MNKNGFTLMEVALFLAVSATLAFILLVGLAPRLRNVRFTDAVRGLETNISQSFSSAQSGVNTRTEAVSCQPSGNTISVSSGSAGAGTAAQCVRNGKIAVFEQANNRVVYRTIVSLVRPVDAGQCTNLSGSGFTKLIASECYRPIVLSDPEETYSYLSSLSQTTPAVAIKGYVIHPETGQEYRFLRSEGSLTTGPLRSMALNADATANINICLAMESSRRVRFEFNNRASVPRVVFNEGCA